LRGLVRRKKIGVAFSMIYTVASDTVGLAVGPISETANDVHEALTKARQMYETGLVNVSIQDQAGHKIDGDELLECITRKKTITNDLQAK
jgi:predicted AlkP superfamily pyrophosphatase or phosphodiesterase